MRLDLLEARERSLVVLRCVGLGSFDNMRATFRHRIELGATVSGEDCGGVY